MLCGDFVKAGLARIAKTCFFGHFYQSLQTSSAQFNFLSTEILKVTAATDILNPLPVDRRAGSRHMEAAVNMYDNLCFEEPNRGTFRVYQSVT